MACNASERKQTIVIRTKPLRALKLRPVLLRASSHAFVYKDKLFYLKFK
nr:MAG TPA: hypothetical protein [Caudoviricetes sp.]